MGNIKDELENKKKTVEEIRTFCKGHFYSDEEEGILWEPFENWEEKEVNEQIETETESLCKFIGTKYTPKK